MYFILRPLAVHFALVALIVSAQPLTVNQLSNGTAPTVAISSGLLRGKATQLPNLDVTVNQFLGIPFAQPPVGDLRFTPPLEPSSWKETYVATEQPNACMQWIGPPGPATDMRVKLYNNPPAPVDREDCLYLNVYVPEGGEPEKAVLFWIYGGSGIAGAASLPLYDGTRLAGNNDIIVVAANYRPNGESDATKNQIMLTLVVFGSPKAPGIPLRNQNPGLLDQRLALEWTQHNITAFGGDPGKGEVFS
jgi:carboxylesterase type B